MFHNRLFYALSLLLANVLFISNIYGAVVSTITEDYDNDSFILDNEGIILQDGSVFLAPNILPDNDTNIISCWRFEQSSGSTVTDSTGSNDGTCQNMDNDNWVLGIFGNALSYNGFNEYVSILDDDSLDGFSEFTLECWINSSFQTYIEIPTPLLLLSMDDNDSTTPVTEEINSYNTVSSTNTENISVAGKIAGAFTFNGAVYLEVDNNSSINTLNDEITLSFWLNATEVTGDPQRIISKKNTGAYFDVTLEDHDNESNIMRITLDDTNYTVHRFYLVAIDTWTHITVVFDGTNTSSLKAYIDGELAERIIDPRLLFYADYTEGTLTAEYSKGSGTASFYVSSSTTSPATYCDENGVIQKIITTHTPRFTHGYYDETGFHYDNGLLIEKHRTNYAQYSEKFDNSTWVKTNVTLQADQEMAPDNTGTADKCIADADNGTLLQTFSDPDNENRCFSIFIKGTVLTDTVEITIDGGTTWKIVTLSSTEWRRFQCYKKSSNPQFGMRLLNENDEVYIWGAQLEEWGFFATSYIPTEDYNGYRSVDHLQYEVTGNRDPDNETLHIECRPEYFVNTGGQLDYTPILVGPQDTDGGYDSRYMFLGSQNGKHFAFKPNFSDSPSCLAESYGVELVKNTLYKVTATCQHSSPYAEGYVNGTKVAYELDNDFDPPSWGTYFDVGWRENQNNTFCGIMKNFVAFDVRLTENEVAYINEYGIESFIGYDDVVGINSVANTNNIKIGEGFIGKLDAFTIYKSPLREREIKAVYDEILGKNSSEPLVHYTLNDDNDSSTIVTEEINSYDGVASIHLGDISVAGKINGAFSFDGNEHIEIDNNGDIDTLSDEITFSFWLNAPAVTGNPQHIISKKNTGAYFDLTLEEYENDSESNLMRVTLSDTTLTVHPGYLVPINTWSYVSIVLDGRETSSLKVYINGELTSRTIDPRLIFYADYTEGTATTEHSKGLGIATIYASRSTTNPSTYCDEDGVMQKTTTAHTPRFTHGYYDETGFHYEYGLLIEQHRSNYALYSEDFTNSVWDNDNISVSGDLIIAPDNTSTADKCVADADNGTILQLFSDSNNENRCFSVFLKGSESTDTAEITIDGGTTWEKVTLSHTDWRRFQCYKKDINPQFGVRLSKAGDEVYLWGAQLEEWGFYATSYFPSEGSAGYRSWEHLQYAVEGNREPENETTYLECLPEYFVNGGGQLTYPPALTSVNNDSGNIVSRYAFLGSQNGQHFAFKPNYADSSSCYAQSYAAELAKNTLYKVVYACQLESPYAEGYLNGSKLVEQLTTDYEIPAWVDYFDVGWRTNQNQIFCGMMKNLTIFNVRLTENEVAYIDEYGIESFIGYDDVSKLKSIANTGGIKIAEGLIGKLDDIRIYDYALNIKEIKSIYNDNEGTENNVFIDYGIISKYDNDGSASYSLINNLSTNVFTDSKNAPTLSFTSIQENEWSHLALTYDNESVSLYLNGEFISSDGLSGDVNNSIAPLRFGLMQGSNYWKGILDEVYLRNKALSSEEIANHGKYYKPSGKFQGVLCNIGEHVESYETVTIDMSNISESLEAYILFSNDGIVFFDNEGDPENETTNFFGTELDAGTNVINITSLSWNETNLYYKIYILNNTNGFFQTCPSVDSLRLEYQQKDTDNDGLSDYDEIFTYLTDPNNVDSDNDGLQDGSEVTIHFTDPTLSDTDNDTLSDYEEINNYQTNANSSDTDGDGISDSLELQLPYYNPHIVNKRVEYSDNESTPDIDIVCNKISRDCLLIQGSSSNERPIKFHFGDSANKNSTFVNISDEFSYSVRIVDCSVIDNNLQVIFVPVDGGASFSPGTASYPIIDDTESKIISPPDGAKISVKGVSQ